MPCWQTQSNTIAMEKMTGERLELFKKALAALGYHVYSAEESRQSFGCELAADLFGSGVGARSSIKVDAAGKVTLVRSGSTVGTELEITNQLKRGYAAQVVEAATKRFGWNVTKREENKLVAQRRF